MNPLWGEFFNITASGNNYSEKGNMQVLGFTFLLMLLFLFPRAGVAGDQIVRISFVGDIMVAGLPGDLIQQGRDPFTAFADILKSSDLNIGNLETSVASGGRPLNKPYVFRASPAVVPVLKRHFHAVSLANNHSGDYGQSALQETFQNLKNGGLDYFGAGNHLTQAHTPLLVERKGLRIALLGYNEFFPRQFEAGASTPGVAWSSEDEQVIADIKRTLKQYGADVVIAYMHWGWEDEPLPCERQKILARKMIDAGATVVIGSHPHILQTVEYYKGALIAYSLGNFVFDGYGDVAGCTGWLLRLNFDRKGLLSWDTVVSSINPETGFPRPGLNMKSPCGNRQRPEIGSCAAGELLKE
jgi:poly-gamma-glutamate synthesis protein (capsule biosynthesis protein)